MEYAGALVTIRVDWLNGCILVFCILDGISTTGSAVLVVKEGLSQIKLHNGEKLFSF